MSTHTPMPWDYDTDEGYSMVDGPNGYIAKVFQGTCEGQGEANARLMAAAPDLLDACQAAMTCCGGPEYWNGETRLFLLLMQAAIAKATGAGAQP